MINGQLLSDEAISIEQANFISKVYAWMCAGLTLTAIVSMVVASDSTLSSLFIGNSLIFYGLLILEIALVWYLSARVIHLSAPIATGLFLLYAALNGLTLAIIFLVYTSESIASTFFITAGTFAVMSAYGYYTKRDLTSWGNLLFMALIGLIIASVVNLFLNSWMLYWITTYAGILIFVGLTAYDTQKVKEMNVIGNMGSDADRKEAIMGALTLYLDFINLFLYLLRIFGSRRD